VIFGCLAVLTVITVAVSRVHLPPLAAVLLAFMIAISKASLVVAFFMHLKYDPKLLRLMCLVPTLLTMVLLLALLPDIASHGPQTAGPPVAAATEEAPTEEAHAAEH